MNTSLKLHPEIVSLNDLLLNPNNPRFFELHTWKRVPSNLYHLDKVQKTAFDMLALSRIGQIDELVDSIKSNGYIPAEVIVVKPYPFDNSKFIVIEGNRRLTAIKQIVQNALDPENDELVTSLQQLDILVYHITGDAQQDQINETILQGIRHISGPKEWGAYQKANLIVQLHDDSSQVWTDIGKRLGLSSRVVGRYYRAYKALRQMKDHEEFGQKAKPDLFSLFDEALKSNAIKGWLRWEDSSMSFTDFQNLYTFYSLLVGDPENTENTQGARITNPQHMRQFSEIIMSNKSDVILKFLEGELDTDDAVRYTKPELPPVLLRDSLLAFIATLAKFPADQVPQISVENLSLFDEIVQKLEKLRRLRAAYLQVENHE